MQPIPYSSMTELYPYVTKDTLTVKSCPATGRKYADSESNKQCIVTTQGELQCQFNNENMRYGEGLILKGSTGLVLGNAVKFHEAHN